jgi:hypothetical protein
MASARGAIAVIAPHASHAAINIRCFVIARPDPPTAILTFADVIEEASD